MACTTFLQDYELNKPLPDKQLQDVLDEVRLRTGENWQVVPLDVYYGKWYTKTKKKTLYGLYVDIGGFMSWQQINFFSSDSGSSINLHVPLESVAAYLYGILSGIHSVDMANNAKTKTNAKTNATG